ncbi:MAG: nucleotide pyrophosphohydrolase [Spirochaetia bacterium]|jgi:NTP pyrophosphatase (non-canonical NTP hydrolase)|uniref:Nucleotide pyrophosphohydrolase n=1 Tax=bioreactor metagenome TaxID=1076179 RepID=A0A644UDV0_9ZZZZ|nr:nucleotide pyrophosphohydrolase [Spirochaetia bacterium]MCE1208674.1 nucleotide pyrophosphohydrolase [Spirochaetia bacterium]
MKNTDLNQLELLIKRITQFRDERDWKRFHNPKDMALSLVLEAAEVMEHFQWKTPEESSLHVKKNKDSVAEELSDVLYWVLLLSHDLDIDIVKAFEEKMRKNEKKYPVHQAKGSSKKYTEY